MDCNTNDEKTLDGERDELRTLYEQLSLLTDKRKRRGRRYPLAVILTVVVLAKLSGEDEVRGIAEWAKLRAETLVVAFGLKRAGMPHPTTYSRILGEAIVIEEFEQVVSEFFRCRTGRGEAVAVDGKTLRGTIESGQTQGQHLLAVYDVEKGVVLQQRQVASKENEISAAPDLLKELDLAGRVVTGDAMFSQQQLSKQIVEAGGDYLWIVKDNQPNLRAAVERLFQPETCLAGHSPLKTDFERAKSLDRGHGRCERRTITVSGLLNAYLHWPHLGQVFRLEREVVTLKTGQKRLEVVYGVTSLSRRRVSPQQLLSLVRRHWQIENRLHYPRDVTFHEDACRLRFGHTQRVMAIVNNLTLGILRLQPFDYLPQARRFFAAHLFAALVLIL